MWFNKIEIINTLIFNQYSSKINIGASDKTMETQNQEFFEFEFPNGAVPTPGIACPNCDCLALYVLPDGGLFANKSLCAACETCWLCGDNSSHHMRFCSTCFCADCGSVKNLPDMSEFEPDDICQCEPEPLWESETDHMDGLSVWDGWECCTSAKMYDDQMSDSDDQMSDSDRPDSIS